MIHQVWFDKKSNAVRMKILGEITGEDVKVAFQMLKDISQGVDSVRVLCDASEFKGKLMDNETRKWVKERAAELDFDKIAMVGLSPSARMLAKIITGILGKRDDTGFFKTEDEALAWLKDEK